MKTLIFSLTIALLTITSCQTANYGNFNKRKFTHLKPIQSKYEENEKTDKLMCSLAIYDNEEIPTINFKGDLDRINENDPKIVSIQKAVKDGKKIIVKSGDDYYEMKKPFYDRISRNLIGELVEVDEETLDEERLEITVGDYRQNPNGMAEISVNDITSYESKRADKIKIEDEEDNNDLEKVETEKTPVKQSPTQAMSAEDNQKAKDFYDKSTEAKNARNAFFTGLFFAGLVAGSIFAFMATVFFPILILAAIAILPALILMIVSKVQSKRYINRAKKNDVGVYKKGTSIRRAATFFMILGIIVTGVGLIIGGGWLLLDYFF